MTNFYRISTSRFGSLAIDIPKNYCLPYWNEPLAPEAGGRICSDDYNGNKVELATVPKVEGRRNK